MLSLKPTCENCDKLLPPDSTEARICSYECTFCADCVDNILHNVCPNCGGGFSVRPVRPATQWRKGVSIDCQPATSEKTYKPVDLKDHSKFASEIQIISPHKR